LTYPEKRSPVHTIYRARINCSTNGGPWQTLAEGVMWEGIPVFLYGRTVPDRVLKALLAFDPVGNGGGTFYAQSGDTRFSLAALRAESFPGVQEWLGRHGVAISAITVAADRSVQVRVKLANGAAQNINLSWDFLGAFTAEQASQYLDERRFADLLAEGSDVHVTAPNYPWAKALGGAFLFVFLCLASAGGELMRIARTIPA
jgi:hypothetical protein